MHLSVYDMDRTIIRRPSWTPWLFFYARTEAPARLLLTPLLLLPLAAFAMGLLDRAGLKQGTQAIMMGRRVPRARVERAAEAFAASFAARYELPGALAAMAADREAGFDLALATASCAYFVQPLARRWGIEKVIATANVWEGDRLTPRLRGENCYGMGKLRMLLAHLPARPTRVKFSSDHQSDLPCLVWADERVVANPTASLRRVARARGWPVHDWAHDWAASGSRTAPAGSQDRSTAPAGSP